MVVSGEMSERVEVGLQVSPAAEGVEDALLLLGVNVIHCDGGQVVSSSQGRARDLGDGVC